MKSLIIILVGIYVSWHFTEFNSQGLLFGVLAPLSLIIFSASLMGWLVIKIKFLRTIDSDDHGYFDGDDSGGGGD